MDSGNSRRLSDELEALGERLRDERPEASSLELDRMKTTVLARRSRGASRYRRGTSMRSRLASIGVALALVVGGTGAVLAKSGGNPGSGGSSGSAPNNQYCPPTSNSPVPTLKNQPPGNKCGRPNPGHP